MFSIPGLGAKKIKALYENLQVSSIAELQAACESGKVAELPGFGKTTQEKLCQAIATRAKHSGSFQLGQIAAEAETLQDDLRAHPDALHVCIAGSYRRHKEIVRDLDFIVATNEPEEITESFVRHPLVETVIAQGPTKIERASALRNSMRSARRQFGGVSVCAQLFYRQQGTQHRDAEPRAATRLDAE